jgi:sugar phosphate isomerase/epimerase
MMQLGIFAKTFQRDSLEQTLYAIVNLGLTHVQFNLSCAGLPTLPQRLEEDYCIWIARSFRERGLTMAAISGTFNLCDPDSDRLQENLHRLGVLAEACRWLDTRIITLCTGTRDPDDMWRWNPDNVRRSTWEVLSASLGQAVRIADRHEVTLALEPEIHNVVHSVSKARRLLDEMGSPWLKIVIDPANLVGDCELARIGEILDEAFDWLGRDIVLAHAKDPSIDEAAIASQIEAQVTDQCGTGLLTKSYLLLLFDLYDAGDPEDSAREIFKRIHARGEAPELTVSEYHDIFRRRYFYRPYFRRLKLLGYDGVIVVHGVDEPQAAPRVRELWNILHGPGVTD